MDGHHRLVLATCCMSLLITGMEATALNLALPTIQTDLHASVTDLQWIVDSYMLGVAGLLMLGGALGDRFGRKRMFQLGLACFTGASLLCSVAPGLGWLIAFRAVQAIGASMLNPLAASIISSVFTAPAERARAFGIYSGAGGVGLGLGPVVGGVLVGTVGWRSTFWLNVPLGLAALVLMLRFVPESRAERPRNLDLVGQALVATFLGGLTFAIVEAPRTGWLSARAGVAAGMALLALCAYVWYELRNRQPMLDLRFFRRSRFSGVIVIGLLSSASHTGLLWLASLYLQRVREHSPLVAGYYLVPTGVVIAICSPLCGRLMARRGARRPLLLSGLWLAVGAALSAYAVHRGGDLLVVVGLAAFSVGVGLINAPVNYLAAAELPAEQASVAAATVSTSRWFGGTLGVAVIGSVLAARQSGAFADSFPSASTPCWLIVGGCGLAILAIGAVTESR